MSAIPIERASLAKPRTSFLELSNADLTLDPFRDRLMSQGYEVITAKNYKDALELVRTAAPTFILVYDDPETSIDAVRWIALQHSDRVARLAMIPLLILADAGRTADLKIEELPDRVIVLQRRADTLNQLTRTVKRLLHVWQIE